MTILVVDDSDMMRNIVIRSLLHAGFGDHPVEEAADGVEAFERAKAEPLLAILSDWNMPNMNGLELVKALRAEAVDTPFGFITSETNEDRRVQALAAGANFVIQKPFTPADLNTHLSPYL